MRVEALGLGRSAASKRSVTLRPLRRCVFKLPGFGGFMDERGRQVDNANSHF